MHFKKLIASVCSMAVFLSSPAFAQSTEKSSENSTGSYQWVPISDSDLRAAALQCSKQKRESMLSSSLAVALGVATYFVATRGVPIATTENLLEFYFTTVTVSGLTAFGAAINAAELWPDKDLLALTLEQQSDVKGGPVTDALKLTAAEAGVSFNQLLKTANLMAIRSELCMGMAKSTEAAVNEVVEQMKQQASEEKAQTEKRDRDQREAIKQERVRKILEQEVR